MINELKALLDKGYSFEDLDQALEKLKKDKEAKTAALIARREDLVLALLNYASEVLGEDQVQDIDPDILIDMLIEYEKNVGKMLKGLSNVKQDLQEKMTKGKLVKEEPKLSKSKATVLPDDEILQAFLASLV